MILIQKLTQYQSKVYGLYVFFISLKEASYAHQDCIYLIKKYSKNNNIMK